MQNFIPLLYIHFVLPGYNIILNTCILWAWSKLVHINDKNVCPDIFHKKKKITIIFHNIMLQGMVAI